MDDHLIRVYLSMAKEDCERAIAAVQALNVALQQGPGGDPFGPAQALVLHAAAISRMFWPPGSKDKHARVRAQRRGEALRQAIDIPQGHPVQSRALRDHIEHFDERLDDWAERSRHRNIVHRLVGPRSAIGGNAIDDSDITHHYDPEVKVYVFRGERFDIQALTSGVDDIYARINARLAQPR